VQIDLFNKLHHRIPQNEPTAEKQKLRRRCGENIQQKGNNRHTFWLPSKYK